MTRKLLRLFIYGCLWGPLSASALGVGKIEVFSGLNQTLDAEIELISVGGEELSNLAVNLASTQAYTQAGLDRSALSADLKFAVQSRADGRKIVKVTSTRPIREPNIDFLVEFTWPKGRLMREFAILLDPPAIIPVRPAPVAPAPTAVRPSSASTTPSGGYGGKTYGPVAFGETLSEIAQRVRPDRSVSIGQMMDALLRANPAAFSKPNVNYLLAGKTLQVPSAEQVKSGSYGAAPQDQVRLLPAEEEQMKQPPAAVTANAPPPASREAAAPAFPGALQIKLDRAGHPSLRTSGLDELRDRVGTIGTVDEGPAATVEDKPSEAPVIQPPAEVAAIAPPVTPMPADATQETGSAPTTGFQEAPPVAPAPVSSETSQEAMTSGQPPAEASSPAPAASEAPPSPSPSQQPASPPSVAAVQPAVEDSGESQRSLFMETLSVLFKDTKMLALAGFVGVLLIALITLLVRRKSGAGDTFTEELAIVGTEGDRPVSRPTVGTGMSDRVTTPSMKPATAAKLMERADLLIAVGKYGQAEDILKSALVSDAENTSMIAKLLEVYFAAGNRESFLKEAEGLLDKLGSRSDPLWAEVSEMGRELCSGHPLFPVVGSAQESTEPTGSHAAPALDEEEITVGTAQVRKVLEGLDFNALGISKKPADITTAIDDEITGKGIDWQFSDAEPETAAHRRAPEGETEERTLATEGGLDWQQPDPQTLTVNPPPPTLSDNADSGFPNLAFELDEVTNAITEAGSESTQPQINALKSGDLDGEAQTERVMEHQYEGLDFEFDTFEQADTGGKIDDGNLSGEDYVETKLDLAIAYLDMGDQTGARSLLEEVLKEGNGEQRQRAEACMARLG